MSLRVLIVEDEAVVAMLLEDMMADLGHQVVSSVGRMEQALEAAETLNVDLAILDVNLSGEMTYPVAERLRERGIKVVFATGYGADGLREDWRVAPVVQKPFQLRDLERALGLASAGGQA